MEKNDFIEKVIGGIFALVAIVAAIIEMLLGDFSTEVIVGGVKDVFSTLVVVVLLFAVAKDIIPKRKFEDRLHAALEAWQQENGNMIIRDPVTDIEHEGDEPSCYSLNLKTNVVDFYKKASVTKEKGLFVRMPLLKKEFFFQEGIELTFYLNKGTFFSHLPTGEDTAERYGELVNLFTDLVNSKHGNLVDAAGKGKKITVKFKKPIATNTAIKEFVEVINTMYTAYLVAANLGK